MSTSRVVHCRRAEYDVYIGRPNAQFPYAKWGNPFVIGQDGNRQQVIAKYRSWIVTQPELMATLHELDGKTLGCYCAPEACHGDVLVELAEAAIEPTREDRLG